MPFCLAGIFVLTVRTFSALLLRPLPICVVFGPMLWRLLPHLCCGARALLAGIFGAHCANIFCTFVAAVAGLCYVCCHVWVDCGCCRVVVVHATLGCSPCKNPALLLRLLLNRVVCVVFGPIVAVADVLWCARFWVIKLPHNRCSHCSCHLCCVCADGAAHVCASKAFYENSDLPYEVMAHSDK